jgi:predicted transcriptional regulator YheO
LVLDLTGDDAVGEQVAPDDQERATRQPGSSGKLKRETLDLLKDVGLAVTSLLGRSCEVVIHDTGDLEHSIVWVQGEVTGRHPGGMMSDLGLESLRHGDVRPHLNYTSDTESGKTLKSASIWIRNAEGQVCGAFCINLDVTAMETLRDFARDLAPEGGRTDVSESHVTDLGDMVDTMIAECEFRMACRAVEMKKDQRLEVVRYLDERGAFQVRNSAVLVAKRLGVTRKTIYNYLREIERNQEEGGGVV